MIDISPDALVSPLADIENSVRGSRIVIAAGAVIDAFVKIKPSGGTGDVFIGPGAVINSGCVLYTGNGIHIGAHVLIAANCTLAPTDHEFANPDMLIRTQGFRPSRGGINIGQDVWIGANTVILDGARIGAGCVVGAHSLLRGVYPEFCIAHGAPATIKGWRRRGEGECRGEARTA